MEMQDLFTLGRDILLLFLTLVRTAFETVHQFFIPPPLKSLRGEIALVTGAGHGIGRELALQLADLGVKIVCWDINLQSCRKTATEVRNLGGQAWAIQCDVSDREAVSKAAEETREEVGAISMLFNNAGIMPCKPFLNHTPEEVEKTFQVNVFSQLWTLFEFLPDFITLDKGHVISTCSVAGVAGTPNLSVYCSSKYAVKGLMDALILEHRASNPDSRVLFTTAHPFTVDTGMAQKPNTRFPTIIPILKPEEVARTIIEAARRNEEYVFVPRLLFYTFITIKLFPRKFQLAIQDFLQCTVDEHDDDYSYL